MVNSGPNLKAVVRQMLVHLTAIVSRPDLLDSMLVVVKSEEFYRSISAVLTHIDTELNEVFSLLAAERFSSTTVLHRGRPIAFEKLKVAFSVLFDLKRFLFHGNVSTTMSRSAFRANIVNNAMRDKGGVLWTIDEVCMPAGPFSLESVLAVGFARTLRSTQRSLMAVEVPCELVLGCTGLVKSMQSCRAEEILKWLHGPIENILVEMLHETLSELRSSRLPKKPGVAYVHVTDLRLRAACLDEIGFTFQEGFSMTQAKFISSRLVDIIKDPNSLRRSKTDIPRYMQRWSVLVLSIRKKFRGTTQTTIVQRLIRVAQTIGLPGTYPGPVEVVPDVQKRTYCLIAQEAPAPEETGDVPEVDVIANTDIPIPVTRQMESVSIGDTTVAVYADHAVEISLSDKRQILEWRLKVLRVEHRVGPTNLDRIRSFIQTMWYNRTTSREPISTKVKKDKLRALELLDDSCFEQDRCHEWRMKSDEAIWAFVEPFISTEPVLTGVGASSNQPN